MTGSPTEVPHSLDWRADDTSQRIVLFSGVLPGPCIAQRKHSKPSVILKVPYHLDSIQTIDSSYHLGFASLIQGGYENTCGSEKIDFKTGSGEVPEFLSLTGDLC